MYPKNMSVEVFVATVRKTFIAFITRREDWTFAMACAEWEIIINSAGFDVTSNSSQSERKEIYFSTCRKGAKFCMYRSNRRDLLLTLENAINHATYEDEKYA